MTLRSAIALLGAMLVLAALPSVSVLAVTTRTAAAGLMHGVATILGIVVGDVLFILLALWGLSVLAKTLGSFFGVIKLLGGIYLMGVGLRAWRFSTQSSTPKAAEPPSLFSSFMAGLLITLGDQKAVFFYLGFFPAFVDLSQLSAWDVGLIVAIALLTVGGVKLIYALLAERTRWLLRSHATALNRIAAFVMGTVGLFVVVDAALQLFSRRPQS